jgi:rubrerythrin
MYWRANSYNVFEAFLIHETGLALAYASRQKNQELEDVIVSGMFTAVQDFINETLSGKTTEEWKLDEMKFSKGKILIEKSQELFIAAIFEGNGNTLRKRIKKILKDINNQYGKALEDWDGDMIKLEGIESNIMKLIPKSEKDVRSDHEESLEIEKEELDEEHGTEEIEEYICPLCDTKIDIEDTECPNCGVHFKSPEDPPTPPS